MRHKQVGVGLIEVLVALLIMCVGLLGAAAIQVNALKYTDSSAISSQVSFIAYDMMDRIRANSNSVSSYAMASLPAASTSTSSVVAAQDLIDFTNNVRNVAGAKAAATIVVTGFVVTITIQWDDTRAASVVKADFTADSSSATRTFVLTSRVAQGGA
jgi:type IV pilus assembly protein PilV